MRRGGPLAVTSSPTIIGALTVLITTLAVFLAYNAGAGLPFVPTYPVSAIVPDATSLVANNEVRIGGIRVGLVKAITPVKVEDGRTMAKLDLELNRDVEPLPVDSEVLIRNRSSLGLKYVEITPGDSDEGYEAGATIPPTAARPHPVELDQVLNTFNERTRIAAQQNLKGFGDALAGRGPDLNEAIGVLAPLLRHAQPVVANLAAPQTNLAGFFRALAATAAEIAPVGETAAQLFVGLDGTFAALASVAPFISDTISAAPATLAEGTRSLPAVRPFLEHSERFFRALEPGAEALADTSPTIASALHAGVPVLNESPRFTRELEPTADALLDFPGGARGPQRPAPAHRFQQDARPHGPLPGPGADDLQLPLDPVRELREHRIAERRPRELDAVHRVHAPVRPQRRGFPGVGARRRPDDLQPPALQPVPEHRLARPAPRVRGRQRDLRGRRDGDRQPAGRAEHPHPGSDEGAARGRDAVTPPEDERARYRAAHHQARRRLPSPLIGALLLIVAIVGPYIAFSKHIPFTGHGYELTATFHNAVAIAPKSPVRIAGVDVGEVLDTILGGAEHERALHRRRGRAAGFR